jgi:ribosome-associated heat shock protein Hsp15
MPTDKDQQVDTMRLDKWLWCARFYKTRSQAAEAVRSGKIQIDGNRCKASRMVSPEDSLTIRQGPYNYQLCILSLSKNRLPASAAATLYAESEASKSGREQTLIQLRASAAMRPGTRGRPTKKERRNLIKFFNAAD